MKQKNRSGNNITRKGQIWVSVVIYTLVAILALVLILNTAIPILTEMKEKAVFTKVREIMLNLDRHISDIASQGEGSQARVAFDIRDGQLKFSNGELIWELETKSEIVSPRTSTVLGNLIISSNANVKTYELPDSYIMETGLKEDTFTVKINKFGSESNWVIYNTEQLIENISYNTNGMNGVFRFNLNNDPNSAVGTGFTEMIPPGNNTNLGSAKVVAHINSSFAYYDLEFILESYADFVTVRVKNFQPK